MTKADFLTVRWNNHLSAGLGIPTFAFIIGAISTSVWTSLGGLIGLAMFGALF
ncbi:MAG: hypothetical protein ACI9K2_004265 [Myxococcota bacterium]|jgi:hypothetical protein